MKLNMEDIRVSILGQGDGAFVIWTELKCNTCRICYIAFAVRTKIPDLSEVLFCGPRSMLCFSVW